MVREHGRPPGDAVVSTRKLLGAVLLLVLGPGSAGGGPPAPGPPVVRELTAEGRYREAEELGLRLLAAAEAEASAPEAVAAILDALVGLWLEAGRGADDEVLAAAERALELRRRALGADDPATAESMVGLGLVLRDHGRHEEAEPLLERALAVQEAALGPRHPEVARTANRLALVRWSDGRYAEARRLLERALDIQEASPGPPHPDLADTLNALGVVHRALGDLAAARGHYERALELSRRLFGGEHPLVAARLRNLGIVLREAGDYSGARRCFEEALGLWEKIHGADHLMLTLGLDSLGLLLSQRGDHGEARRLLRRSLELRQRHLRPDHPEMGVGLNNLALAAWRGGDAPEAEELLHRALAVHHSALEPDHPVVASTLSVLGAVLAERGDGEGARVALERSLAIRESRLGGEHPGVATCLVRLAALDAAGGRWRAAVDRLRRAVAIRRAALGPDHPDVAAALADLARAHLVLGDLETALEDALEAEAGGRRHLRWTIRTLPEPQALRYAAVRPAALGSALAVAAERADATAARAAWDSLIRSRALVLDEMASRRRPPETGEEPETGALWRRFETACQRLANLYVRGPRDASLEEYRGLLAAAQDEKEAAQRALAERSARFRAEQGEHRIGFEEVAAALPDDAALLAYARYERPRPGLGPSEPRARYLAFLVRGGETAPRVVPLGPADEIDALLGRLRRELTRFSESRYRRAGERVRRAVWDPVAPFLSGRRQVFVVPDSGLHLLHLAALPAGAGAYLVEGGAAFHHLSAERDLVVLATGEQRGEGLLAVGGADFDADVPAALPAAADGSAGLVRGSRSACGAFRAMRFAPLPQSAAEAGEVVDLWRRAGPSRDDGQAVRLTGGRASEPAFKALAPGKRILHLATHGLLLARRCPTALAPAEGYPGAVDEPLGEPPLRGESPLLLSGLVLAGANRRARAAEGEDDGILTAEEIAALDLAGVEWAVLSACASGAGEIQDGEGIFGLRRAFRLAGARTVITSLWPEVDDAATRGWVRRLYRARWVHGLPTAEAVRQASLVELESRRRAGSSTHPYYWAGFVAEGAWN